MASASRYKAILEQVVADYGVAADSDMADHIATLITLRKAIRDRAWRGDVLRTDPDDFVTIDTALKQYQRKNDRLQVNVNFVKRAVGIGFATCPECGHRAEHRFEPEELRALPPKPAPVAQPAPTETPPAASAVAAKPVPANVVSLPSPYAGNRRVSPLSDY
jgi:hypothetical protein